MINRMQVGGISVRSGTDLKLYFILHMIHYHTRKTSRGYMRKLLNTHHSLTKIASPFPYFAKGFNPGTPTGDDILVQYRCRICSGSVFRARSQTLRHIDS